MVVPADPGKGPGDDPADVPRWTVAAVAAHLGVAPATLRSWGRRYGIGPADHRAGRYRRYTDTDVAELETMQRLAADGMVLSSAAALARRHRRPGTSAPSTPEPEPTGAVRSADADPAEVRALVHAAQRLDADTLVHALEISLQRRDVSSTWEQLCRPALAALDPGSSTGAGSSPGHSSDVPCADGALMLARAITTVLHQRFPAPPPTAHTRRVLLSCAPGEHHLLALDVLSAALIEHHLPVAVLGPAPPAMALRHATEHIRPPLVLVWAQRPATASPAVLRRLARLTVTVAAGPGWSTTGLPEKVRWVNSFADAIALAREATAPGSVDERGHEARGAAVP